TLEHEVNLILLDVQMPGMDGFETAGHLRMTERTRGIPIVFVTAIFKAEEFISRGYGLGAVDYLMKPLDDNLLLNRVRLYQKLHERETALHARSLALQQAN
ncbi:response regulator, partial [Chromobacterium piscinae]